MSNEKIKFSHNFCKLSGQHTARLMYVDCVPARKLHNEFIAKDTAYVDSNGEIKTYPFPKNNVSVIVLVFLGMEKFIPFTTFRSFGTAKRLRYEGLIGRDFDIVIEEAADEGPAATPDAIQETIDGV
jgi:hypothetical protein